MSSNDLRKDQYLKANNQFSRSLNGVGTIKTTLDYTIDLDQDNVTEDIKNHVVQKLPEIDMTFLKKT